MFLLFNSNFFFNLLSSFFLDLKQINETTAPKENPFSFTQFLKRDTSVGNNNNNNCHNSTTINGIINSQSISNINGNDILTLNGMNTASPSKSATTSSLNTGTRPKIPQFQSVNLINVDPTKMKRSPKFSSFDSQSSLSDLAADEKSSNSNIMQSSRSNNSFNMEYQPPSSTTRSFSNYDIESPMMNGKQHSTSRNFNQRSQNNVNNSNNSTMLLPDFVQDHLLMEYYMNPTESPSANLSPLSGDEFGLGNNDHNQHHNGNNEFNINYVPSRNDIPFDLTFNRSPNSNRRRGGNNQVIPLDLPLNNDRSHRSGSSDLPPDITNSKNGEIVTVSREETYGSHNEPEIQRDQAAVDKMQTLPDFLSDGPIHSGHRLADVATVSLDDNNQSIMIRLQQENDRLRQDLDENRREMMEQARRIEDLEMQINHAKNLETQYNVTLAESMEQVEENLFVSNVCLMMSIVVFLSFIIKQFYFRNELQKLRHKQINSSNR